MGGGSIFQMSYKYVFFDSFLWVLMAVMFCFMIAVDRIINYSKQSVKGNYCLTELMDKIQAELLMFGAVAISLFLFENILTGLDDTQHMQFEFVDIVCSFGACALLAIGGTLYCVFKHVTVRYQNLFEQTEDFHNLLLDDASHQPSEVFMVIVNTSLIGNVGARIDVDAN